MWRHLHFDNNCSTKLVKIVLNVVLSKILKRHRSPKIVQLDIRRERLCAKTVSV